MSKKLLLGLVLLLVLANVLWRIFANWGLVTVRANGEPLHKVIRSIERQGHITLHTNLDRDTPVTLNVKRVPLAEALETLAAVTESQWRLAYLFAPEPKAIYLALAQFESGTRTDDWTTVRFPMPQGMGAEMEDALPDPRRDRWNVTAPAEPTLRAYVEDAARSVDASFMFPKEWNPAVSGKVGPGEIRRVAPKLAKRARAAVDETFLLVKRARREDEGDRPGRGARWDPSPEAAAAREARAEAQIARLPPEQQAAARERSAERRAFRESLRDLPEEERRARMAERMQERMEDPVLQERMESRMISRDQRRTPEQRIARYRNYVERKANAKSGRQQ